TRGLARWGHFFNGDVSGLPGSPLVLLLHGFPQTSHTWRHQLPALAAAGYFAVAPNPRGYSPYERPATTEGYSTDRLIADARTMAKSLGYERFNLVGHDWGGQLSWLIAAQFPAELASLTVLWGRAVVGVDCGPVSGRARHPDGSFAPASRRIREGDEGRCGAVRAVAASSG